MKFRAAASVALAATIVGIMSACAFITPQQTTRSYTPSDGVNGRAGDVEIRNMIAVTNEDGSTVSLVGALVNTADADRVVTLQYSTSTGTESTRVRVPSGLLSLRTGATESTSSTGGTPADEVVLDGVDATSGALFKVAFVQGSASESLQLPVLPGSLPEYATLVPTATPTPTKTRKAQSDGTEATPEPTASAE